MYTAAGAFCYKIARFLWSGMWKLFEFLSKEKRDEVNRRKFFIVFISLGKKASAQLFAGRECIYNYCHGNPTTASSQMHENTF